MIVYKITNFINNKSHLDKILSEKSKKICDVWVKRKERELI
jgi:hypothetical protein